MKVFLTDPSLLYRIPQGDRRLVRINSVTFKASSSLIVAIDSSFLCPLFMRSETLEDEISLGVVISLQILECSRFVRLVRIVNHASRVAIGH